MATARLLHRRLPRKQAITNTRHKQHVADAKRAFGLCQQGTAPTVPDKEVSSLHLHPAWRGRAQWRA
jgi:hypothetical protein